jgi:predicted branched-subunit amino acid permease
MPPPAPALRSAAESFLAGARSALFSVFFLVLFGTYVGIGALAHDYGFSLTWVLMSSVLVWAGPAQVILLSALGTGATAAEVALAVGLSGVRLLPMVVALLPLLKRPGTRTRDLLLPAHLTAVSMWVEALRILPTLQREERIAFCNGLGLAYMGSALVGTVIGFYLAASLPPLLSACMLFLTPMSFLVSTVRNSRSLADAVALGLGLVLGPLLAYFQIGLDLLWTGMIAGSIAYGLNRLRLTLRGEW